MFISDKLAEEITVTIGQAFELAYKRFLETSGKDLEAQRRAMLTQQKIKRLELENNVYKQRLLDLCQLSSIKHDLDHYLKRHDIKNVLEVPMGGHVNNHEPVANIPEQTNGNARSLLDFDSDATNGNGNGIHALFYILFPVRVTFFYP